jgi:hypothetical protein
MATLKDYLVTDDVSDRDETWLDDLSHWKKIRATSPREAAEHHCDGETFYYTDADPLYRLVLDVETGLYYVCHVEISVNATSYEKSRLAILAGEDQ